MILIHKNSNKAIVVKNNNFNQVEIMNSFIYNINNKMVNL